ncbi:MAG: hypothetical protein ACR65R_07165 [Methylomicrobium sp.]
MTIPSLNDPSEHILRRALVKRTAGFIGVVSGATYAQRHIPIRLQFNDPDLNFHADSPLLDQNALEHPVGVSSNGEDGKRSSEAHVITPLSSSSPETCPFALGGNCSPYNHLNITLGNEEVGRIVFHSPGLNSFRTLAPKPRYFQAISGKRLACLQMELKLRGKPTRQHSGLQIYYVDITIRSGMTLEKTLANARGTATRWFRSDRLGQCRSARIRQRRFRNQIKMKASEQK